VTIDVLYLAWNRLAFTRFSFEMLIRNTDWSLVRRLVIHDDDSHDGTTEYLRARIRDVPADVEFRSERRASPPAVMNWYVGEQSDGADAFAKIDNDIVVPPDWLGDLAGVMARNPEVELLGMEAGRNGPPGHNGAAWDGKYAWTPGSHIGGIGLMRTEAFACRRKMEEGQGRFGFTEWQHEFQPVRGWVVPDLLVCSLDQVPLEPWRSLTAEYFDRDWSRRWPEYHEQWSYWWDWWPADAVVEAIEKLGQR
jgi:glycosyltransferase involved in cell wall biosynthesis